MTGDAGQQPVEENEPLHLHDVCVHAISPIVLHVDVCFRTATVSGLIDSGSSVSLLHANLFTSLFDSEQTLESAPRLCAVNGEQLPVLGSVELAFCLGNCSFVHSFVLSDAIHKDVILGSDFLFEHGGVLDVAQGMLTFGEESVCVCVSGPRHVPSQTLGATKPLSDTSDTEPVHKNHENNHSKSNHPQNIHHINLHASSSSDLFDASLSARVVEPMAQPGVVPACAPESVADPVVYSSRVVFEMELSVPAGHVVLVPCAAVDVCTVAMDCVADPLESFMAKHPDVAVTPSLVTVGPNQTRVVVAVENHANHPILIHKNTNVAELHQIPTDCEHIDDTEAMVSSVSPDPIPLTEQRKKVIDEYINAQNHLSTEQSRTLTELLHDNHDLFILHDDDYGYCDIFPHKINTGQNNPIKQPTRRIPYHRRKALQDLLNTLLKQGIIQESISPWASPIVLVPKKDGSLRLCIDYRKLNSVTEPDAYPIPRADDMLDSLSGCRYFTSLDLASGYWQIAMEGSDKAKTAFTTPLGLFEFNVLPMGCRNGPATFQRVMEAVLSGLCNTPAQPFCRVFFDDVLNASETLSGQLQILLPVFARVRSAGLRFNLKKCSFFQEEVTFLGHRVSAEGISPNEAKLVAVRNWKTPKSVTAVREFLGFAGYYRRFIRGFAQRAAPLTALTGKNSRFAWSKACEAAFQALKRSLASAPVMAYPQFEDSAGAFILDTDASNVSIGAVLSQIQDGTERPIGYGSRVLTKAERNYDASDREALALVYFAEYFRHYLLARPFVARTDNTALTALRNLKEPRGRKARWLDCLSEYEFRVVHRPGRQHLNADGLSRLIAEPEAHVHSESPPLAPTPPQDAAPSPPPSPPPLARDVPSSAADEMPLAADVPPAAEIIPPAVFVRPPGSSAAGPSSPDCFKPQSLLAPYADPALSECFTRYDAASGKFVRPPEAVSRPPDCHPPAVTASRPDPITLSDDDLPRCVPPLQPPSSDPVRTSSPVSRRSGRVRTAPARLADYVLD